ncbi:MAG: NUDIX hydrolase [Acidobacteriaceae bacterium]
MVEREYPTLPILGVGAVVLHSSRVLLVRRAKPPLAGEWSLPGGAVELGETMEQAIVREVAEETGLAVAPIQVLKVFDHIVRESNDRVRFHYVLVDFLCGLEPTDGGVTVGPALHPKSDVSDARWVPVEGLRNSREFPLTALALEVIEAGCRVTASF